MEGRLYVSKVVMSRALRLPNSFSGTTTVRKIATVSEDIPAELWRLPHRNEWKLCPKLASHVHELPWKQTVSPYPQAQPSLYMMIASACSLLTDPQKWQDQAEEIAGKVLATKAGGPEFDMAESWILLFLIHVMVPPDSAPLGCPRGLKIQHGEQARAHLSPWSASGQQTRAC